MDPSAPGYASDSLSLDIDLNALEMDNIGVRTISPRSTRSTNRGTASPEEAGPARSKKPKKTVTKTKVKDCQSKKLAPVAETSSESEEKRPSQRDICRPPTSQPSGYYEGVYTRLDNIAAKLDTLIGVISDSTMQMGVLATTVGLQQTRIESLQTTVTRVVTIIFFNLSYIFLLAKNVS